MRTEEKRKVDRAARLSRAEDDPRPASLVALLISMFRYLLPALTVRYGINRFQNFLSAGPSCHRFHFRELVQNLGCHFAFHGGSGQIDTFDLKPSSARWVMGGWTSSKCRLPASQRLSYFLWSSIHDEELFKIAADNTLRDAMEKHRTNPGCASCHSLMDPIGSALENFNGAGDRHGREVWRAVAGLESRMRSPKIKPAGVSAPAGISGIPFVSSVYRKAWALAGKYPKGIIQRFTARGTTKSYLMQDEPGETGDSHTR